MSYSDDDMYDDDYYYDDDDEEIDDDDEEVGVSGRSSVNPFRSGGSGGSSGLPGSSRSSGRSSSPFGSRSTDQGPGGSSRDRFSSRVSGTSRDDDSESSRRDRQDAASNRERFFGRSSGSSSSSRSSFGSRRDDDDDKSRSSGRSSFGSGSSSSRFGSRRDDDDDKSRSSGGGRSPFGGSRSSEDDKDKQGDSSRSSSGSSGQRGSFSSRFGRSGDKDQGDRSSRQRESSGDDSGGSGLFSGITGRFRKSDDDQSRRDRPSRSSGGSGDSGGIASKVSGVLGRVTGKSDDPGQRRRSGGDSGGGGLFSGVTSRLRKSGDDQSRDRGGDTSRSSFGSRDRDQQQSRFGQSRGESRREAQPSRQKSGEDKPGLFGRVKSALPSFGGGEGKRQRTSKTRERASKVPRTSEEGLSMDTKLDILGVGLVFGALVLTFSSLSGEQGAITGAINNFFAQLFGWGALGVPIAMAAVGVWLIIRHFGEDAPEVDPVRVSGIVMLYLGALMIFMFVETFNEIYQFATQETFDLFVQQSVEAGRGGGLIGAELYSMLVVNFGEIPAIIFVMGWVVVGLMLATRTSAAEMAIFVISIWRSFQVSMQRRAQRRAAMQLAEQQPAGAEQISVSRPDAAELPAGTSGALPAPAKAEQEEEEEELPIEERPIPIRMGGQMVATPAGGREQTPAAASGMRGPSRPSGLPESTGGDDSGLFGGVASRLRDAVPALPFGDGDEDEDDTTESSSGSALFGLGSLLSRGSSDDDEEKPAERPASKPPVPSVQSRPAASTTQSAPAPGREQPAETPGRETRPAASAASPFARERPQTQREDRPTEERPAARSPFAPRTGEGERSSPFARPERPAAQSPAAPEKTETEKPEQKPPEEDLSKMGPARPRGTGPAPREQSGSRLFSSRFSQREQTQREEGADDGAEKRDAEEKETKQETLSERLSRLNAIRSGKTGTSPLSPFDASPPKPGSEAEIRALDEDEEDESAEDEAVAPEDVVKPSTPTSRVRPFPGRSEERKDDEPRRSPFQKPERATTESAEDAETEEEQRAEPERPAAFKPPSAGAERPPKVTEAAKEEEPEEEEQEPAAAKAEEKSAESRPEPLINPAQHKASQPTEPTRTRSGGRKQQQWRLPDIRTLLSSGSEQDFDREALVRKARIIEETLQSFGAPGRVVEINTGPVITQFGVEPDYLTARGGKRSRVKVSAIAQLDKDLQLALGAKSIRIEAPVPGKGYVGIEVPNDEASLVSLRDVMESNQFQKIRSPLAIALGQSVDGAPVAADLSVMPHLLVAGTTGAGKSVCVNSIIASLVTRNSPEHVKFVMVDPKRVELTGYNGIPHLIAPVVVELERIVGVLKWVTREMDERYKRFSNAGARNIEDFNAHLPENEEHMPYIIVIIDELADLMMLAPDETERVITRIAALARATGIHLVISTQRPSVDVVTGLIKANFPARIAFAVASGVDSRVILDQPGAERLLGRGDMLYLSPDSPAPLRLQGVFVSDMETNNIIRFWKSQAVDAGPQRPITQLVMDGTSRPESRSVIPRSERFVQPSSSGSQRAFWDTDKSAASASSSDNGGKSDDGAEHEDELYGEAVELVRRLNKASVSLLQRRLRIGYTRAARLIDTMEAEGIVGPPVEGSKPREVLPHKD